MTKLASVISTIALGTSFLACAGLGVAAASNAFGNETVETEATVTNGKYRFNILTNSYDWTKDNVQAVFNPGGGNVQMSRDTDFPVNPSATGYSKVTINNTEYSWITYEASNKNSFTSTNVWFGRGTLDSNFNWFGSGFNAENNFKNNNYDNTLILNGSFDNFTTTNFGWYNKIALHAGLDNNTISYALVNKGVTPANPVVIEGYDFDGWYTDSGHTQAWNANNQVTDVNLYAKYTAVNYQVTVGSSVENMSSQGASGEYIAQYKATMNVEVNSLVSFTANSEPVAATADSTSSNNVCVSTNKILNSASSTDIWLKKKANGTFEYWVSNRSASYYLYSGSKFTPLVPNPESEGEYYAQAVSLTKDDTVELYAVSFYNGQYDAGSVGSWSYVDGKIVVGVTDSYNVYYTPSQSNKLYFGSPSSADKDATEYAQDFVDRMKVVCKNYGQTNLFDLRVAWLNSYIYFKGDSQHEGLSEEAQGILRNASTIGEGILHDFARQYDWIISHYTQELANSGANFAGRTYSNNMVVKPVFVSNSDNIVPIIAIVAVISVSAIGGFIFYKTKRKEH